jgi:hypothetical protein
LKKRLQSNALQYFIKEPLSKNYIIFTTVEAGEENITRDYISMMTKKALDNPSLYAYAE